MVRQTVPCCCTIGDVLSANLIERSDRNWQLAPRRRRRWPGGGLALSLLEAFGAQQVSQNAVGLFDGLPLGGI